MTVVWMHRADSAFAIVERFISEKLWGKASPMAGDTILVSANAKGDPLGAAIYQNYTPENGTIEISAAAISPTWLSRQVLREMFSYPFGQLKCQAVVLRCGADDRRMDRIARAYGFQRYDIPRLRGRDKGEAVFILTEEDWRANGFHKEIAHGQA